MSAVVKVERLLRARMLTCRGRLGDLAADIVAAVRDADITAVRPDAAGVTAAAVAAARSEAAQASIAADCYQLALERLVDRLWPFAGLPAEARQALEDAVELLRLDSPGGDHPPPPVINTNVPASPARASPR